MVKFTSDTGNRNYTWCSADVHTESPNDSGSGSARRLRSRTPVHRGDDLQLPRASQNGAPSAMVAVDGAPGRRRKRAANGDNCNRVDGREFGAYCTSGRSVTQSDESSARSSRLNSDFTSRLRRSTIPCVWG